MTQTNGWAGKILQVDLTDRKVTQVPTSDFEPEKFVGGQGLNCKVFWEMGCPTVEAFHPDNPLILSNGPLTGTSGPFTRATMCSIAPQCYPEELFTYSGFGGKFPSELKYAGYDSVVITGRADEPVYLLIHNDEVEIRDAVELWGQDTFETQKILMSRHPRASVLTIGPAGENLSRIAIVLTETSSAAGQGGYGAVMGSKNLKAIVTRGTGSVKIARPDDYMELIRQTKMAGHWESGPGQIWAREPHLPHMETLKADMNAKYLKRPSGCYACPYQCHGVFDIPGIGRGSQMCGDWWYGFMNPSSIKGTWAGALLSQKLGINNIELFGIMAFLLRCIDETGLLTKEDFGLTIDPVSDVIVDQSSEPMYRDERAHQAFVQELLTGIAEGTSIFTQGTARAAEQLGPKAMELFCSLFPAWGNVAHWNTSVAGDLHWATDTRDPFNSCHDYIAFGDIPGVAEWFSVPSGYGIMMNQGKIKKVYEETEKGTVWVQNHQSLKNSLPICNFASHPFSFFDPPDMDIRIFESRAFSMVTGLDVDVDALWEMGERICNIRRAIMVLRENRHRNDDTISHDMYHRATENILGIDLSDPFDEVQWEALKDRYYKLRGWDISTGVPTRSKLEGLGMKSVFDRLQDVGK